jgi:hypothetical protein
MTFLTISQKNAPWQIVNGVAFLVMIGDWFYYPYADKPWNHSGDRNSAAGRLPEVFVLFRNLS